MDGAHKAVKIAEKVYWVGAIDWRLREFHGYSTPRGTTYNAYLVLGEKPILLDTVKAGFAGEMLSRIASVIPPEEIKIVVSNHSEMDHSGELPSVLKKLRPEKVLASEMGVKTLRAHFHEDLNLTAVSDGQKLDAGGSALTFYESRMLHWPDSMVALLEGENVLFSNDIFGMHAACGGRFDDETPAWRAEAAKYYANIVLPYSAVVKAFLAKAEKAGIRPKIIAPDHGPVWRKNPAEIVRLYGKWAGQKPENKAVIAYDTMWGSTEKLAGAIAEGVISGGSEVRVMPLSSSHRSEIASELLEAGALVVGSPVLNKQVFPTVADLMVYLIGLARKNLVGAAFGSYGWAPSGIENLSAMLKEAGVEQIAAPLCCHYVPDEAALSAAFKLGAEISARLRA